MIRQTLYYCLYCLLLLLTAAPLAQSHLEPWVLVDTRAETVTVMGPEGPLEVFENLALGVRGAGLKQRRGDELTPLGSFQVGWINPDSRFDMFIGLNYPNLDYATTAYHESRIDQKTYDKIRNALAAGRRPPQNTVLGGYIGIHGTGGGSVKVHQNFNWTNGCVALTNRQANKLASWVKPGTRVEIR